MKDKKEFGSFIKLKRIEKNYSQKDLAELFKVIIFKDENKYKYVPIIVGFVGGGLGVILNLLTPFTDIFTSIMIGIISGLASTGANQIIKQFKKGYGEKDD